MKLILKKIINYFFNKINLEISSIKYKNSNTIFQFFSTIFKIFKFKKKIIIFDVGANKGQSIKLFKEILENIQVKNFEIFSFEPNPTSYNKLKLLDNKNLIINNIALSNFKKKRGGGGRLFYVYEVDTNSGFYINPRKKIKNKIKVNMDTIDDYCQKRNIKHINFLKIDCEGSEPEILCGAKKLINAGAIDCIYLEVSIGNLYLKTNHKIYDIEKMLYKNYTLCGLNTNGNYAEIINSVHQHAKHLSLCLFYLKNKIFNNLETKI